MHELILENEVADNSLDGLESLPVSLGPCFFPNIPLSTEESPAMSYLHTYLEPVTLASLD